MATIDNLGYKSISDVSQDEAIEMLRQIRLSRRVPLKKAKKSTKKAVKKSAPKLSKAQALKLLDMIKED